MPPTRKPRPLGRYALGRVIAEIDEQFQRRGHGARTALASAIGFRPPDLAKRQEDVEAHWNLEDLGRVADAWDAPAGWPFIPWDQATARDVLWAARNVQRKVRLG